MPSAPDPDGQGEFDWIERLLRPLTLGAPGALDLLDDAAVIRPREGHDLVVTKDAMVAGVHFLPDDPLDTVARKLLAVNLSDLAAKGAEPIGYVLSVAWPKDTPWSAKVLFTEGLAQAGRDWRLPLLGGDTVSTPGPLTVTATLMGEVPTGGIVLRRTARPGDLLMVSGPIGDGWLGLQAARGMIADPDGVLAARYRTPMPRLDLIGTLRQFARASADVSDGLLADAGRIAIASGLGVEVALDQMPLSPEAAAWLALQADEVTARLALATGGDDYQIVCSVDPAERPALHAAEAGLVTVGRFKLGQGVGATFNGHPVEPQRLGWTH
ncbi:thiamine-phosphate kinase [Caulobacter sp. NIBR1757]|uniref:thiamine-phosphate kinase n=1 Tax=Caulobacter sp. NIBR1757 TaxID=3016000 RepID=UPI0022F120B4|nr:thiamine-phosphate kinase [Caulobacter sp. NIBR1757]WGM38915.1 Thiamine-monophosphate kinase [Caulobacter sp. NIBR1757]